MKKILSIIFLILMSLSIVSCKESLKEKDLTEDELKDELEKIELGEEVLETTLEIAFSGFFQGEEIEGNLYILSYSNKKSAILNVTGGYSSNEISLLTNSIIYIKDNSENYYGDINLKLISGPENDQVTVNVKDKYYYMKENVSLGLEEIFVNQEELILSYIKNDNIYEFLSKYEGLIFYTSGKSSRFTFVLDNELLIDNRNLLLEYLNIDFDFLNNDNITFDLVANINLSNSVLTSVNFDFNLSYLDGDTTFDIGFSLVSKKSNYDIELPDFSEFKQFEFSGLPGSKPR